MPGVAKRNEDPRQRLPARGAAERRRLQDGRIDLADDAVERQDDERQHDVGHADGDADQVVDQRQRLVDQAKPHQRLVDDAGALQEHHPGVGAGEKIGPHRQKEDGKDDRPSADGMIASTQATGKPIASDTTVTTRGHDEGVEEDLQIGGRCRAVLDVVVEAELGSITLRSKQCHHRQNEEHDDEAAMPVTSGRNSASRTVRTLPHRRWMLSCSAVSKAMPNTSCENGPVRCAKAGAEPIAPVNFALLGLPRVPALADRVAVRRPVVHVGIDLARRLLVRQRLAQLFGSIRRWRFEVDRRIAGAAAISGLSLRHWSQPQ